MSFLLTEPLFEEGVQIKARCNTKVLTVFSLLAGVGLGMVVVRSGLLGQQLTVQDPAIDMAALQMPMAGAAHRAQRVPVPASRFQASPSGAFGSAGFGASAATPMSSGKCVGGWQGLAMGSARSSVAAQAFVKEGPITITILGATGLVGLELLELIPRAWPGSKLQLFASRDKTLEYKGVKYEIKAADNLEKPDAPKGDLAMVALDDDFSRRYVPRLLELGYRVVDKSNCYRMDPNVPLVVGGVNSDLVTPDVKLVANPNCNTIPFCLAVAPLQRKYGLKGATVSSYQAISGAGIGPLDDFLAKCAAGYKEGQEKGMRIPTQFDPTGYASNVFPHNGKTDDSGFSSEERKLIFESRKILREPDFDVNAQCCRVPVAVGHYENAWVTFDNPVSPDDAQAVLTDSAQAPFVHYIPGAAGDGISTLAGLQWRDDSVAGRVRSDPRDASGKTLCMTVLADNLRQGAATNAMRVASCWFPSKDDNLQAKCFPPK